MNFAEMGRWSDIEPFPRMARSCAEILAEPPCCAFAQVDFSQLATWVP
jgi:hypothetical protein